VVAITANLDDVYADSMAMTRRTALRVLGLAGLTPLGALPGMMVFGSGCRDPGRSPQERNRSLARDPRCPSAASWAAGGTAAMTGRACYPDPFAVALAACPLVVCETTDGPCTAAAPARVDISERLPGLPVRLELRLVTADACAPVVGAQVEIWHAQRTGAYSGLTSSVAYCSGGDRAAPPRSYFRGTQVTDGRGRVGFDTCFPGWYPGRALHIHVRVSRAGEAVLTSQLLFDQQLVDDVVGSHPDYADRGPPDTTNDADPVFQDVPLAPYLLAVQRMPDGAMLASKQIALRRNAGAGC